MTRDGICFSGISFAFLVTFVLEFNVYIYVVVLFDHFHVNGHTVGCHFIRINSFNFGLTLSQVCRDEIRTAWILLYISI